MDIRNTVRNPCFLKKNTVANKIISQTVACGNMEERREAHTLVDLIEAISINEKLRQPHLANHTSYKIRTGPRPEDELHCLWGKRQRVWPAGRADV